MAICYYRPVWVFELNSCVTRSGLKYILMLIDTLLSIILVAQLTIDVCFCIELFMTKHTIPVLSLFFRPEISPKPEFYQIKHITWLWIQFKLNFADVINKRKQEIWSGTFFSRYRYCLDINVTDEVSMFLMS